jgi:beta-mannosidase
MKACPVSSTITVTEREARGIAAPLSYPGRPRVHGISTHETQLIDEGWVRCAVAPGAATDPESLHALAPTWDAAAVPGTVASSFRADGQLDLERAPDFDAHDWWYRCHFAAAPLLDAVATLCLDGLATLADVWLNGRLVLTSDDMFIAHEVDVTSSVAVENELLIRFRSLRAALETRRPRPRWRTKIVEHQQLRWHRTTLLGRMPGWSPPVRPVGPWRGIRLERRRTLELVSGDVYPIAEAQGGRVDAAIVVRPIGATSILGGTLFVGGRHANLAATATPDGTIVLRGELSLPEAAHWWPHTHGEQPRYEARATIETEFGTIHVGFGRIAFRESSIESARDGFAVRVNGVELFCRGACWTTPDIVSLSAAEGTYRELLTLARDAGMNMLRIGGTMVYEADCFYDICDELGILVWQDFMFANMDYPAGDTAFVETVRREAVSVLARLRRHPSLAVLCGNSEVEQQAAMLGLAPELWSNSIFRELLPEQCAASAPGVPYWPASPSGGSLPFHSNAGVAHYYGVGAYLRPLEDARRSDVRFTSECLGFSNVPEPRVVDALLPNGEAPFHHPRWKVRVPRDHGAGWDFEDVRDHYLSLLFGVDPMRLRYSDADRYLALSRVVTGEVMARTIGEWRRGGSTCRGALVWFYQDLWLGAGWGVLDAAGRPKAAYYALKRAMAPIAVAITDEGANGVHIHLANDRNSALDGELTVSLLRGTATIVASVTTPVRVAAHDTMTLIADTLFGQFHDTAYAYRFGPPGHDVVVARLCDRDGRVLSEVFHFPLGLPAGRASELRLTAAATRIADDIVDVELRSQDFAQSVALDGGDYLFEDNYFHMAPGSTRVVRARARRTAARFDGFVQPLNAHDGLRVPLAATEPVRVPA